MGTFLFKWPHREASEVYVTGTFDDWGKTEKLNKVGDTFEKEVTLPDASQKILYKFVVDGNWTIDRTAPQEDDGQHNVNNILNPEHIKKRDSGDVAGASAAVAGGAAAGGLGAALLSSVHPESTSAKLAGEVPKENEKPAPSEEEPSSDAPPLDRNAPLPGAFPETPAQEPESFSINPIPASAGASNPVSLPPGETLPDHQGITGNTIDSRVTTSKEDYEKDASSALPEKNLYGINPIPASAGASNPVSVPPGEELPDHQGITGDTIDSHVTTSKEDYEKDASSALPEENLYGINPIPASAGASNPVSVPPGETLPDHEDITGNTIDSHVTTSKEDYEKDASSALPEENSYGVDPIPASAGIGNPVSVPAGESVEQHKSLLPQSLYANVTTSKEDYEKAGSTAMPIGMAVDGATEPNNSVFSVPEKTKDMIPESSLPMSGDAKDTDIGPFIQTTGPGTTTAALAGLVPLEPKSKARVVEDGASPGTEGVAKDTADTGPFVQSSGPSTTTAALAGGVPLEPQSKAKVVEDASPGTEDVAKDTSDTGPFVQSSGPSTTTAALAGGVPLEPTSGTTAVEDEPSSDVARDTKDPTVPSPLAQSSGPSTTTAALAGQVPLEPKSTPTEPSPFVQSSGSGTTSAALAGQVPLEPKSNPTVTEDEALSATVTGPAPHVPEVVKESLSQAQQSPEAAASAGAVEEKKLVENELLQEVKVVDAAGEPAPTAAAALSATAPLATAPDSRTLESAKAVEKAAEPSRDISPMGRDVSIISQAPPSPVVTTGVGESNAGILSTPEKTAPPPASSASSSPAGASNGTKDKKKKRTSIFGRLKEKFKS